MSLSYSQLRLYRTCPRQYEYAVVKKLPRPITPAESFGSSVHNALKKWGETEIRGQIPEDSQQSLFGKTDGSDKLSPESLHLISGLYPLKSDRLRDLWHQTFSPEVFATRMEADLARQRGERLMEHFYQWWNKQSRTVLAVEKGFSLAMDGLTLTGRFDRVENTDDGVHVIDFKTFRPPTPAPNIDADLQLSIYAIAAEQEFDKPCTALTFLFLEEEKYTEHTTQRTPGQLADAHKQILSLHNMIGERDFHPTPAAEKCKRCPYRNVCEASAYRD